MYNSIVLICSEITSQKKIHLTIFFYLSIKKALEDFLHDNRDSSHKHTGKRWGSTPHHLNCFIDFPHHRVIFQCWHASILFLSYQYVTWLKNIWAPILKLLPLHVYNIPVSVWKGVLVKECFYLLVQKAAQWLWHQQPVTDWINLFKQLTVHL